MALCCAIGALSVDINDHCLTSERYRGREVRCPCFFALKKLIGVMTKIQQFLRCLTWNCVIRYVQMLSFRQQNNYVVSR